MGTKDAKVEHRNKLWLPAVIILVAGIYVPAVFNGFVNWDDHIYVTGNRLVNTFTAENLRMMFTTSFDGHYHPLTLFSLALDHLIAGDRAWFYHLVSLCLHLANTVLVFMTSRKFLNNIPAAALAALVFGIHPVNVEAVAWISGRKDVLSGFFFLLSWWSYLRYIKFQKRSLYGFTLLFFVSSVLAKEQTLALASALILTDWYFGRKWYSYRALIEKIPFFVLAIIAGMLVIWAQAETGYFKPLSGEAVTFYNRLLLGCTGLAMYLFKLIIPVGLSAFHPYPFDSVGTAPSIFLLSIAIIPVLIILLIISYSRARLLFFGLMFFLINIFLLLRLLQANPGDFIIAERYLYMSSVGIFIVAAGGFYKIVDAKIKIRRLMIPVGMAVIILLGVLTSMRIPVWNNSLRLLDDILGRYPDVYTAINCRGDVYAEMKNYDRALADFDKAVTLNPHNDRAWANRGRVFAITGDYRQALADMEKAVTLDPGNAENYLNRGIAIHKSGNNDAALRDFDTALQINPGMAEAFAERGNVRISMRDFERALQDFDRALEINTQLARAYVGRGIALSSMRKFIQAVEALNTAIRLEPGDTEIIYQRGLVYYSMQQFRKAADDFSSVIRAAPDNGYAFAYRGFSFYNLEKYNEALADLDRAIEIIPGYDLAIAMRGMTYLRLGQMDDACSDFRFAANLGNRAAADEYKRICEDTPMPGN